MEAHQIVLLAALYGLLWLSVFSLPACGDGCFWTAQCMHRWIGGCGNGYVAAEYSDDCRGLCPQPQYAACLPFQSHVQCCMEGSPQESEVCSSCSRKLEMGDEWMCCSDCSEPTVTNQKTLAGYCKSGARLSVQAMLPEVVSWVAGDWHGCSCSGGYAMKHRDVFCVSRSESQQYSVDEGRCSQWPMPSRLEPCGNGSVCEGEKSHGMPVWAILLLCLLGAAAVGGLVFGGFVLYKRYRDGDGKEGLVYVMLEGYS